MQDKTLRKGTYNKLQNSSKDQIIAIYAKGMSTRDIEDHIWCFSIDGKKITDRILPMTTKWQLRPLERVYPIVYLLNSRY